MATKDEILAEVRDVLVDSLAADEDQVTPDATLVDDLGAESIDLLEIVFNLEKKFDIKIDRSELIPADLSRTLNRRRRKAHARRRPNYRRSSPGADMEEFKQNPLVQNVSKILTSTFSTILSRRAFLTHV